MRNNGVVRDKILSSLPAAMDHIERYLCNKGDKLSLDEKLVYTCGKNPTVNSDLRVMTSADDEYICCKILGGVDDSERTSVDGMGFLFAMGVMRRVLELDGEVLTCARTAAISGIAARQLAPQHLENILLIGAGHLCLFQLRVLEHIFPEACFSLYDISREACEFLVQEITRGPWRMQAQVVIADTLAPVARSADVIVTLTPSRKPLLRRRDIKSQVHINAIGSDTKGKRELSTDILVESFLVVDDEKQSCKYGEQNVPLKRREIESPIPSVNLLEILTGSSPQHVPEGITVFDATGLASYDLAFMRWVYESDIL